MEETLLLEVEEIPEEPEVPMQVYLGVDMWKNPVWRCAACHTSIPPEVILHHPRIVDCRFADRSYPAPLFTL